MSETTKSFITSLNYLRRKNLSSEKEKQVNEKIVTLPAVNIDDAPFGLFSNVRIEEENVVNQIIDACKIDDELKKQANLEEYKPQIIIYFSKASNSKKGAEILVDKKQIREYGYLVDILGFSHTKTGGINVEYFATNLVKIHDVTTEMINKYNVPYISKITGTVVSAFETFEEGKTPNIKDEINFSKAQFDELINEAKTNPSSLIYDDFEQAKALYGSLISINEQDSVIITHKNAILATIEFLFWKKPESKSLKQIQRQFTITNKLKINSLTLFTNLHKIFLDKNDDKLSAEIDNQIETKLRNDLDKQQKDFILREKMRIIKDLIDDNNDSEDISNNKGEIQNKNKRYPDNVLKVINEEQEKLRNMMPSSPNADITKTYIDNLKSLPWRKTSVFNTTIANAQKVLEKNHYGLEEVKKRIVEYIAIAIRRNEYLKETKKHENIKINDKEEINLELFKDTDSSKNTENYSPILTLVGPPGTGKTSLAKSIANALGRKMIKISLGGVHDEAEIRGHRRTYVGAMPGKIIQAINKAGVSNPVILLDEIDKMSNDRRGDPTSALLEVLDPEQNSHFQDNYIELEYDLSEVMFVATANYYENIPPALIDRVEIIELNSYTISEKIKIAREYLIDRVLKQNFANKDLFSISDEMLKYIIKHYTLESGVRGLYRQLDKIVRKITVLNLKKKKGDIKTLELTKKQITQLLGVKKIDEEENEKKPRIGAVNGLAYTSYGGSTLEIEVTTYPGKGELKLTGQLKDVMQESAQIAATYVRANAKKFGIDFNFEENTIHIHVPEGATPKDGPSAGVTFTTAIISALAKKEVPTNIGMTGEITLRGKVLEIGGLKEKSFAAYQKGITKVYIPFANKKHLSEIPKEVSASIKYVPVTDYKEIFNDLFTTKK
ncbi:ATP-dependent protease La [Mycoplasmopsis californica]|uniref:endopeptidase La n=1 Tax=Mycoplasmopsis equigenitalium TaxID=114883 RepID=A0ABY5J3G3_9BACT|nr:endopeptidase La [Mycoplasmopsis equigenitalium]UUD37269.1 endopeptidase La [Mycoplasmopsis equigenitalium]VEU69422.1 ATP-dependent protease La [Mycoplasmopsis californica]